MRSDYSTIMVREGKWTILQTSFSQKDREFMLIINNGANEWYSYGTKKNKAELRLFLQKVIAKYTELKGEV